MITHGRIPLELIFETEPRSFESRRRDHIQSPVKHLQAHAFTTWHWTNDRPLSLAGLRSVLGTLPAGVYRAKGIICFEELPVYRYVLQMVGRRYTLNEIGPWGSEIPRSEIVLIGARGEIDAEALQHAFDASIGTGDETASPVLRLTNRLMGSLKTSP